MAFPWWQVIQVASQLVPIAQRAMGGGEKRAPIEQRAFPAPRSTASRPTAPTTPSVAPQLRQTMEGLLQQRPELFDVELQRRAIEQEYGQQMGDVRRAIISEAARRGGLETGGIQELLAQQRGRMGVAQAGALAGLQQQLRQAQLQRLGLGTQAGLGLERIGLGERQLGESRRQFDIGTQMQQELLEAQRQAARQQREDWWKQPLGMLGGLALLPTGAGGYGGITGILNLFKNIPGLFGGGGGTGLATNPKLRVQPNLSKF